MNISVRIAYPRVAMPKGLRWLSNTNAAVGLDTVHQFRDPECAALKLRLRNTAARRCWQPLVSWRKAAVSFGLIITMQP
ncbi:hypothetical protein [Microbacterium sp. CJ77]|uniref:hypothetical protein n=1 Tax=Microbacterium sp. CJ77 TaxID=2079201 RepID=UPI000CD88CF2|nr:hypothetical protein [Microbacterium sp. CJ77]